MISMSVFLLFWTENTFQKLQKIKNVLLFFLFYQVWPQTFYCYIFYFESFFIYVFQFHSLEYDLI
jgi:hypothetical protein